MKIKDLLQELQKYDPESEVLTLFSGLETYGEVYTEPRKLNLIESGLYTSSLNEYYSDFSLKIFEKQGTPVSEDCIPAIFLSAIEKR